jgi:starch synthase (maltosyl-transferring)
VDRFICVSGPVAEFFRENTGIPADKIVVIPNGIDVSACNEAAPIDWATFGLPRSAAVLLLAGRLDWQKGIDRALRLAGELVRSSPEVDPHLVILGDGPLRPQVEAAVRQPELAGRVHYLGWQAQPLSFIRAASVVLLTSRWEGMPNVILEAMACGKPVVSFMVEGVGELLGEGGAFQVVPQDQPSEFVARVRALLVDPELARTVGQANRSRAESNFSLERMVQQYENLWLTVLKEKGKVRGYDTGD